MNKEQMIESGLMNELGYFKLEQVEKLLAKINLNSEILEDYKELEKDKSELEKVMVERKKEVHEYNAEIEEINKKIAKIDHYQELNDGEISVKSMKKREELQTRIKELKVKSTDSARKHNSALSEYNNKKELLTNMNSKIENSENILNDSMNTIKNIYEYCSKDLNEITTNVDNYQQEIAMGYHEGKVDTDIEIATLKNRLEFLPSHYTEIMDFIKQSDEYENTELKTMISEIKNNEVIEQSNTNEITKTEENKENSEINQESVVENEEINKNEEVTQEPVANDQEVNENIQEKSYMPGQSYWERQYPRINEVEPYKKDMSAKPMSLEQLAKEEPIFKDESRITKEYMSYQNANNLGYINDHPTLEKEQKNNNIINIEYAPEGLLAKLQYKFKKFQLTDEAFKQWCEIKQEQGKSK